MPPPPPTAVAMTTTPAVYKLMKMNPPPNEYAAGSRCQGAGKTTITADARRQYIPSQWSSFQVFRCIEYSSPILQKIGKQ